MRARGSRSPKTPKPRDYEIRNQFIPLTNSTDTICDFGFLEYKILINNYYFQIDLLRGLHKNKNSIN